MALPSLNNDEIARYSRHLILPEVGMEGQQKLKAAKVLCVGTGGLGSPLAFYLAAAGVGTLGLVDFDVVDSSNLQRQIIHSTKDVGRSKLDSAEEKLTQFIHDGWLRLGLTGEEIVSIRDLADIAPRRQLVVEAYRPSDGKIARFPVRCRIDTPTELEYFRHGGVLNYVLRNLAKAA